MTKFECRKTDTAKKSDFVIIYSENRDTSFPPTRWGQRHFFLANMKLTIHFLICSNERKSIREICLLLLLPNDNYLNIQIIRPNTDLATMPSSSHPYCKQGYSADQWAFKKWFGIQWHILYFIIFGFYRWDTWTPNCFCIDRTDLISIW